MKVNFFDLTEQYKTIKSDVEKSILEILDTQRFVLGKYVSKIETDLASLCGSKYAVAVSSGTDAILSALMALDIKPEDEIILPDFTFFATAGTIARLNAVPVFVDIDKNTYNISAKEVRKHITKKTKAIIPVHIYGYCANIEELNEISREFNIPIIEDACQAIGSEYKDGRRAGNLGLMGCFSFYPTKNLGGGGDSGAVTTNDEKIYNKLK
ncbi:MAG: aminotransferase class I/II-fold pyridoxal phosphate-dependent enzyme, partial [Bacteroidetes bacterium]|nr:aminotransferase class I/II-fold pyridoxal phosphate-dependent enzyme [Bacteroidota bacterium]